MSRSPVGRGPSTPPAGDPQDDGARFDPGFGPGKVPALVALLWIAFFAFFAWYAITYQLPDFLEHGPGAPSSVP